MTRSPPEHHDTRERFIHSRSADESPLIQRVGAKRVRAEADHPVITVDGHVSKMHFQLAWVGRARSVGVP